MRRPLTFTGFNTGGSAMDFVYVGLFAVLAGSTALLIALCARVRRGGKERA